MGSRPWFGATYANYTNYGATVRNNVFQGAVSTTIFQGQLLF